MIQVCWFKWHFHFHFTSNKKMIQVCGIKWHSQVSSLRSKFCRRVLRCSHPHQTLSKGHFLLTLSWTFDKFSQQDSLNLQPCLQDWFEKGGVRGFQLYTYPLRWVGQWVNATSEFWHTEWLLRLTNHPTTPWSNTWLTPLQNPRPSPLSTSLPTPRLTPWGTPRPTSWLTQWLVVWLRLWPWLTPWSSVNDHGQGKVRNCDVGANSLGNPISTKLHQMSVLVEYSQLWKRFLQNQYIRIHKNTGLLTICMPSCPKCNVVTEHGQ